jgi:hypothetical protein
MIRLVSQAHFEPVIFNKPLFVCYYYVCKQLLLLMCLQKIFSDKLELIWAIKDKY